MQPRRTSRLPGLLVSLAVLMVVGFAYLQKQPILDWARLRNYQPPAEIVALADQTTMTDKSRHLFYVNHPQLEDKTAFNQHCPNLEKTYVLGCYVGVSRGIYLYDVQDERLHGVEEVTAAHEMLHVAYERLSGKDKQRINRLLEEAYAEVTDTRLRANIDSYQQAGADVANELHSILGTEVRSLPPELEDYYAQYFTERIKVVSFLDSYVGEIISRKQQVADYDTQLEQLKQQINISQTTLGSLDSQINTARARLEADRAANNIEAYNAAIPGYQALVRRYNGLVVETRTVISQYNKIVEDRNKIAVEEEDLGKALDSRLQTQ